MARALAGFSEVNEVMLAGAVFCQECYSGVFYGGRIQVASRMLNGVNMEGGHFTVKAEQIRK